MADDNILIMPESITEEELEAIKAQYRANLKFAYSLTKEQLNFLMDGGWYNNAMRGYLIASARNADFSPDEIKRLLNGLRCALDSYSKEEAEQICEDY